MESKNTQQLLDEIIEQLGANGALADQQAAVLPACLAHLEAEEFKLAAETFHLLRREWARWPSMEPLTTHLCLLIERERVRRELSTGWEIGQLVKISELT